ncbi:Styryl dye vacuolar localization protein 3 [Spathaspora sp. JA1]|nr:Styryl dye vacuolar localization protein 3 [Spathaspora sp. JA1]
MSNVQVITIGSNPNVAFYAWRLFQTKSVEITIVNSELNKNSPISWKSSSFGGNSQYTPHNIYSNISQVSSNKYDIVILSCSSLQDFQNLSNEIKPILEPDSIILIESTGYINLEPFFTTKNPVMSIMNESDVRRISGNNYIHQVRNKDTRIYFGSSNGSKTSLTSNINYHRIYKLLQTIQEDSKNGDISLLKSLTPNEFMTYQWKLALPRIIFSPLMIIFEIEFPQDLANQILSKPLITGLINELFKLIKKMNCKLVKGFENELNLLKSWCENHPKSSNENFKDSPTLVYNYYKHFDLELDLLLLQPILLSDDNKLKSPYLENLYSIMSQYNKINSNDSIYFVRRSDENYSNQCQSLDEDLKQRTFKLDQLETTIKDLESAKLNLSNEIFKQENNLRNIKQQSIELESKLSTIQYEFDKKYQILQLDYDKKFKQLELKYQQKSAAHSSSTSSNVSIPIQQPTPGQDDPHPTNRDSIMTTQDNLHDLADIVQYGMVLNGENQPTQETKPEDTTSEERSIPSEQYNGENPRLPPHVLQKELELQRREQALAIREQQHYPPQQSYYDQQQYYGPMPGPPPQQRQYSYPQGYQQPPHGLPSNGMPVNSMPPLKSAYSMNKPYAMGPSGNSMNGYHHPMHQQHPPQPRRASSTPAYYDHQPQPQYYQPPPQENGHIGAPIDPYLEQRFRQNSKKQNRRSNMGLNMEGIDMGGRGGMPGSTTNLSNRKSFSNSQQTHSPTRRSMTAMNLQSQTYAQSSNGSGSSDSNHPHYSQSSSSGTSGETSNDGMIPSSPSFNDPGAKPLGGISQSNLPGGDKLRKQKKKGLFGR